MFNLKGAAVVSRRRFSGARLAAIGVVLVAAIGTGLSVSAQDRHGPEMGGEPGMMMFGGPPERMAHGIDRMLDGLNATDAQRSQIKQIAMSAAADLKAQRSAGRGLREQAASVFTAPNVDPAAAESLRQQMMAQRDQASKRVLQAMLDVSRVLTPEQRAKIGERMKERQAIMQDRMQRMQRMPHEQPPK